MPPISRRGFGTWRGSRRRWAGLGRRWAGTAAVTADRPHSFVPLIVRVTAVATGWGSIIDIAGFSAIILIPTCFCSSNVISGVDGIWTCLAECKLLLWKPNCWEYSKISKFSYYHSNTRSFNSFSRIEGTEINCWIDSDPPVNLTYLLQTSLFAKLDRWWTYL